MAMGDKLALSSAVDCVGEPYLGHLGLRRAGRGKSHVCQIASIESTSANNNIGMIFSKYSWSTCIETANSLVVGMDQGHP